LRYERRRRFTAIAGGAAAAAVVGVGTTALVTMGGSGNRAASGADKAGARAGGTRSAATGAAGGSGRTNLPARSVPTSVANVASTSASRLSCPVVPDHLLVPGGGGTGQFGSSDPLFAGTPAAMKVCAYPVARSAGARSVVLGQPEAGDLAGSLDASPVTSGSAGCPANTDYVGGTLEILGVDARGRTLKPVVITLGCVASSATNGTALRYVTHLPDRIVSLLVGNTPGSLSGTRPGRGQGSTGP
jgi:hypothetical protein